MLKIVPVLLQAPLHDEGSIITLFDTDTVTQIGATGPIWCLRIHDAKEILTSDMLSRRVKLIVRESDLKDIYHITANTIANLNLQHNITPT